MKRGMLVIALMSAPLLGDEVYLKGGGQISGEIVDQNETTVTVDIGGGTLGVRMSTVVRIDKESTSPLQEYRARAAKIGSHDAEAWRELARWAGRQSLATQSREAWKEVTAIIPGDPEANQALGRVELNGAWVSEEESYLARGFVDFEGEWMKPEERQSILAARQAEEEADRAALNAQIQAQQQAAAEREAQERAEHDAYWNSLPQYGDPVYWGGWGTGPLYWPSNPAQPGRPNRPATTPSRGRIR
jgi:hypothetical protein